MTALIEAVQMGHCKLLTKSLNHNSNISTNMCNLFVSFSWDDVNINCNLLKVKGRQSLHTWRVNENQYSSSSQKSFTEINKIQKPTYCIEEVIQWCLNQVRVYKCTLLFFSRGQVEFNITGVQVMEYLCMIMDSIHMWVVFEESTSNCLALIVAKS